MDSHFYTVDQIKAENFKGLENFEANFNNTSVILFGSEATGKTNVWLLVDSLKKLPSAAVKKGADKASGEISVSKGDTNYRFCFDVTPDNKHKLTTYVDGEDKAITKARQAYILEQLIAPTINIDDLINSTGQKQVEIIKKALQIDTSVEEAYYKQKFDARKDLKRDLTKHPKPDEVKKVEEVSLNTLLEDKKKIEDFNKEQDAKQKVLDYYLGISKKLDRQVSDPTHDDYLEYIATSKNLNKEIIQFITGKISTLNQPKDHKSLNDVNKSIENAETTNKNATLYKTYLIDLKKHNELVKQVEDAEKEVKEAREQLLQKIQEVDIPIDGLEFDISMSDAGNLSTTLMYNGLEFNDHNINTSKKFAIAARLQMSLFQEGQLATFHCNSSFMSNSTVEELAKECAELGIQALFEITAREDNQELKVESIL